MVNKEPTIYRTSILYSTVSSKFDKSCKIELCRTLLDNKTWNLYNVMGIGNIVGYMSK